MLTSQQNKSYNLIFDSSQPKITISKSFLSCPSEFVFSNSKASCPVSLNISLSETPEAHWKPLPGPSHHSVFSWPST
ncbi:hypothetical protein PGT21_021911 [Puccinia graminis f. sp. tritici]|uniref:Uncharacterized protein n=1 Tax=Puccinia graminis f. sp. tritici TaxID=56615 RepID=A0A5B0QGH1_PUCGR|nr:hypothetical protein PGT21_021911 [Puccinia graminis f. sp. tritici]